jgi:hypothetical protein
VDEMRESELIVMDVEVLGGPWPLWMGKWAR